MEEQQKKQTYSASHKKYYETHREVIAERRKQYSREYAKRYYAEHKDEINSKRKQRKTTTE